MVNESFNISFLFKSEDAFIYRYLKFVEIPLKRTKIIGGIVRDVTYNIKKFTGHKNIGALPDNGSCFF